MHNISQIKEKLQSALSIKRYAHSIGVSDTAAELAPLYCADVNKAVLAGLLHDCAKDMPHKLKLNLCREYHIELDSVMKEQPDLTHSFLGAEIAAREYGVTDSDVLNAIRYHTTGRANMSTLEKIVYLADFVEPNRATYKSLNTIRELAYKDLNEAVVFSLKETIKYCKKKNQKLHKLTPLALKYYE